MKNRIVLSLLAFALIGASAQASMVQKMGLNEMADRAGSIFRGTVVSASPGTVEAGGGIIRTVDYVIEVSEGFKGSFESKDDKSFATIRMLANIKGGSFGEDGELQRFSPLPDLPQLAVGGEYLLLATTPGPSGLSTTVGLGQGCFSVSKEQAVNELNNLGLYEGPVAYDVIANDIRAALGQ
jgi:hypothetical protein